VTHGAARFPKGSRRFPLIATNTLGAAIMSTKSDKLVTIALGSNLAIRVAQTAEQAVAASVGLDMVLRSNTLEELRACLDIDTFTEWRSALEHAAYRADDVHDAIGILDAVRELDAVVTDMQFCADCST
jgi:hypothetical protein